MIISDCTCFAGDMDGLAVQESTFPQLRGVHLLQDGIVNNANLSNLIVQNREGNARMRERVDEIHGAVNGVNDPRSFVRESALFPRSDRLFSDEPWKTPLNYRLYSSVYRESVLVMRKVLLDALDEQLLDRLVRFRDQIDLARLFEHRFLLVKRVPDDLKFFFF